MSSIRRLAVTAVAVAALTGGLVAEVVDEPGEPVHRPQVRARLPRREDRGDREVLAAGTCVDLRQREPAALEELGALHAAERTTRPAPTVTPLSS